MMNRKEIENTRKASKFKVKDLIQEAGISKGAYYRAVRGHNTTTETLWKIEKAILTLKQTK